jgi:hypothetical protein
MMRMAKEVIGKRLGLKLGLGANATTSHTRSDSIIIHGVCSGGISLRLRAGAASITSGTALSVLRFTALGTRRTRTLSGVKVRNRLS